MNQSSNFKFTYRLNDEYRKAQFVTTGKMPTEKQAVEFDMTLATASQRATIARLVGTSTALDWTIFTNGPDFPRFSGEPTIEQFANNVGAYIDTVRQEKLKDLVNKIAANVQQINNAVSQKSLNLPWGCGLSADDLKNAEELGVDTFDYKTARAEYDALQPEFARLHQERLDADEAARAVARAKREAEEAAADAEKRRWITEHGSAHLKRACNKEGYDCARLYALERSALEAPGYTLDFEEAAEWKSRACPSTKALDEVDAMRTRGFANPLVVWLTDEPRDHHKSDEERYYPDDFEPCEAVVIQGYLGKYNLVKIVGG